MNERNPQTLPRKSMTLVERRVLKMAADELVQCKPVGALALADLVDLIASWHGNPNSPVFSEFARRWVADGNARTTASGVLLRDLFGEPEGHPRGAA
jgi:hypothetical protein